jgi:phage internal scaffolding protein
MATAFRKPYDGKRNRVPVHFIDEHGEPIPTLTKQEFKEECDVNNVLKRYDSTGLITHVNTATAHYGDFTEVNEYQQSLNAVMDAQRAFSELPSEIRKEFANDPGKFFEFATDPKNSDRMVELGLAVAPAEPTIQQVEVVNPEPSPEGG